MLTDGLFDLQVNGYAGVDFNDDTLIPDQVDLALQAMLAAGVTGCLPTLITAHKAQLASRLQALDAAVSASRLGASMVPGYHLEGPFLNPAAGYEGCHPGDAMIDPDLDFVARLEAGLSRPVLLISLAPERVGAVEAVRQLAGLGKTVAMAHSAADFATVRAAAEAGMTLSTHLGNGLPRMLPKLEKRAAGAIGRAAAEGLPDRRRPPHFAGRAQRAGGDQRPDQLCSGERRGPGGDGTAGGLPVRRHGHHAR